MDAYIGEIRMFAGTFAPEGWLCCDGQLLSVAQYNALYAVLGVTYGGDGVSTFALPDLRGRLPVHGTTTVGQKFGVESLGLGADNMPTHGHAVRCGSGAATDTDPTGRLLADAPSAMLTYTLASQGTATELANATVGANAGGAWHSNMMPSLCLNFIICCADGEYPPRP